MSLLNVPSGRHFTPLHSVLVEEMHKVLQTGEQAEQWPLHLHQITPHHTLTHSHSLSHTNTCPSGNTFIDEISEHITQFVQRNLMTELALDPSDESLLVSREKVNGHIYHMFKEGQVTLPEPVSRMGWVGRAHNREWAGHTMVSRWGTQQ